MVNRFARRNYTAKGEYEWSKQVKLQWRQDTQCELVWLVTSVTRWKIWRIQVREKLSEKKRQTYSVLPLSGPFICLHGRKANLSGFTAECCLAKQEKSCRDTCLLSFFKVLSFYLFNLHFFIRYREISYLRFPVMWVTKKTIKHLWLLYLFHFNLF